MNNTQHTPEVRLLTTEHGPDLPLDDQGEKHLLIQKALSLRMLPSDDLLKTFEYENVDDIPNDDLIQHSVSFIDLEYPQEPFDWHLERARQKALLSGQLEDPSKRLLLFLCGEEKLKTKTFPLIGWTPPANIQDPLPDEVLETVQSGIEEGDEDAQLFVIFNFNIFDQYLTAHSRGKILTKAHEALEQGVKQSKLIEESYQCFVQQNENKIYTSLCPFPLSTLKNLTSREYSAADLCDPNFPTDLLGKTYTIASDPVKDWPELSPGSPKYDKVVFPKPIEVFRNHTRGGYLDSVEQALKLHPKQVETFAHVLNSDGGCFAEGSRRGGNSCEIHVLDKSLGHLVQRQPDRLTRLLVAVPSLLAQCVKAIGSQYPFWLAQILPGADELLPAVQGVEDDTVRVDLLTYIGTPACQKLLEQTLTSLASSKERYLRPSPKLLSYAEKNKNLLSSWVSTKIRQFKL